MAALTKNYIGTKKVKATPMNRLNYNEYRGWELPEDENGADEGYLVEYLDGGESNHSNHTGYISWSPKEVFDKAYKEVENDTSYVDRMEQEFKETYERMLGAEAYLKKNDKAYREVETAFISSGIDEMSMLRNQVHQMQSYLHTLGARIMFAKAKEGLL